MRSVEEIQSSIESIGTALKEIASEEVGDSKVIDEFQKKVLAYFPRIELHEAESGEDNPEEVLIPLWWDDLDEPFEIDPLHWQAVIQKIDLLPPDLVPKLMEEIEAGVLAEGVLNKEVQIEGLTELSEFDLQRVIAVGQKAFETMVTHNLKLVLHLSRRYGRRVELEDAFSYGTFGLLQAIKKFDWRLGNQLSTYATWWIRQSLTRNIADFGTLINVPVHAIDRLNTFERDRREFEVKEFPIASEIAVFDKNMNFLRHEVAQSPIFFKPEIDETLECAIQATSPTFDFWEIFHEEPSLLSDYELPSDGGSVGEFQYIANDLTTRLTAYVLSAREADVVLYRHGYIGGEPLTLDEIGKKFDVTRERIRQIEVKAMKKISHYVRGVTLDNYWDVIEERTSRYLFTLSQELESSGKKQRGSLPYWQKKKPKKQKKQKSDSPPIPRNTEALVKSNLQRTKKASENQIIQLKWALDVLKDVEVPSIWLIIAKVRIENPDFSYLQVAREIGEGLTKDAVASTLRRIIEKAKRI